MSNINTIAKTLNLTDKEVEIIEAFEFNTKQEMLDQTAFTIKLPVIGSFTRNMEQLRLSTDKILHKAVAHCYENDYEKLRFWLNEFGYDMEDKKYEDASVAELTNIVKFYTYYVSQIIYSMRGVVKDDPKTFVNILNKERSILMHNIACEDIVVTDNKKIWEVPWRTSVLGMNALFLNFLKDCSPTDITKQLQMIQMYQVVCIQGKSATNYLKAFLKQDYIRVYQTINAEKIKANDINYEYQKDPDFPDYH